MESLFDRKTRTMVSCFKHSIEIAHLCKKLTTYIWDIGMHGSSPQSHPSSVDLVPVSSDHQHHDDANDGVNDDAPLAPQLDDIKIKYHPHSKIPSTVHAFSNFSCHCPTEDTMPHHTSPWEPFCTRLDFEVAEIALAAMMTKDQTNRLFELMRRAASTKEDFTLQSHDEVHTLWKMASEWFTPVSHVGACRLRC